ncbi:hypothetical protein WICMUC_003732 [Wickerhamomyces mucosus]|uniref:Uncharacterized protein n=1 Tax=Wickerhamomyces mucosus TaxID=1378264 RepID=A0A9P8PJ76_9ASCO|nr:hypothetical protein WICMUC_003732 [Wickerhamomyces mucosus]
MNHILRNKRSLFISRNFIPNRLVPRIYFQSISTINNNNSNDPINSKDNHNNQPLDNDDIIQSTIIDEQYPKVSDQLYFYRDPDLKWDDVQNRRNFGEVLNIDDDVLNLWSPHYYDDVNDLTAIKWQLYFFGSIGLFSSIIYLFFYPNRKAVPRNFPDGLAKDLGSRLGEKDRHLYEVPIDKTFYDQR